MTQISKNLCETLYQKAVEACTTEEVTACPTNDVLFIVVVGHEGVKRHTRRNRLAFS